MSVQKVYVVVQTGIYTKVNSVWAIFNNEAAALETIERQRKFLERSVNQGALAYHVETHDVFVRS